MTTNRDKIWNEIKDDLKFFIPRISIIITIYFIFTTFSDNYIRFDWTTEPPQYLRTDDGLYPVSNQWCKSTFWGLKVDCYRVYYQDEGDNDLFWYYYNYNTREFVGFDFRLNY
jgi:hypothetical protein